MRLFKPLARSAARKSSANATPKPAPRPARKPVDAYEHLRRIADLDNEATRQIDEAQALLARTLEECPAIYVEAAIARLKAAREIISPVVGEQVPAGPASKAG